VLNKYKYNLIAAGIILLLLVMIYLSQPAPDVLSSYSVSLDGLTQEQHKNICLGAYKLNRKLLRPGELFSFNTVVGPRTLERGFVPSRAIFEGISINSTGGGICLLSSGLYNAVIRSNLQVVERHAHTSLIRSVPVGLDATVWYGKTDLKFTNNYDSSVRINSNCSASRLNIYINGKKTKNKLEIAVKKHKLSADKLQVSVYRKQQNAIEKISEDVYLIK
jgi:vancomycin resistance protein YoaR